MIAGTRMDGWIWMDEEADVLPVESATSSAGEEVEINSGAGGDRRGTKGAIGACQGVGASRARGCRLAIRREAGEGIVSGATAPRLTLLPFSFVVKLCCHPSSAVPFSRSRRASTSGPSDLRTADWFTLGDEVNFERARREKNYLFCLIFENEKMGEVLSPPDSWDNRTVYITL